MVDTPIDPMRIIPVNLSGEEIEALQERINLGELPRDFLDRHYEAVAKNVFGHDHKKDRNGRPIEQGLGSPGNMTQNAIDAYIKTQTERRVGGPEAGFEEHLKRMRAELAECEARRKGKPIPVAKKAGRK